MGHHIPFYFCVVLSYLYVLGGSGFKPCNLESGNQRRDFALSPSRGTYPAEAMAPAGTSGDYKVPTQRFEFVLCGHVSFI